VCYNRRNRKEGATVEKKKYKSNTRAKNKWNAENYDRLYPYVKIGKKALYQKAVEAGGFESMNDLIESATDARAAEVLGMTPEEYAAAVQAAAEETKREKSV
jgi:5'-3' exonuclease